MSISTDQVIPYHNTPHPFVRTLSELESAVGTPLVPGELKRWCAAVADLLNATSRLFDGKVTKDHAETFASIELDDPGLMTRVSDLRTTDEHNLSRIVELKSECVAVQTKSASVGADEASAIDDVERFVVNAQQLIIDLRQQETAITTWQHESLNRDRGEGD